ncbi:MAG: hypothetical protein WCB04_01175 [Mycobacteriales bacterium]
MCRPATCKVCGKTTWAGCGQHVDQVMARVPRADRCAGHSDAEMAAARSGSFFGRLFGRG